MNRKGILQPLALAMILTTGFLAVWSVLGMWAEQVGEHVAGSDSHDEHLLFLPDGTARVVDSRNRHEGRQYRELDGHPVPPPENENTGLLVDSPLPTSLPDRASLGDGSWDQRIRSFADGGSPAVFWYFVADGRSDGTAYFVGYDSKSKVCVGYLGTAGLRTEPPPLEEQIPFTGALWGKGARVFCTQPIHGPTSHPEERVGGPAPHGSISPWDIYVLGRDSKIYHADLQNRTVHVALEESHLRSAALAFGVHDPVHGRLNRLAARTHDAVLVLDERGQVLKRYPIPDALRERNLAFAETTTQEAVMHSSGPLDGLATEVTYDISWVPPEGAGRRASATLRCEGDMRPYQVASGVVVPAPLVVAGLIAVGRPRQLLEGGLSATYPAALARALMEFAPALLIAHILAAGLAVLCYRRQARYGTTRLERVLWQLFVLAYGLPGWIGYRFGQSWPALEACPTCGADVPRNRGECVHCEVEFPGPTLKGTEVFA